MKAHTRTVRSRESKRFLKTSKEAKSISNPNSGNDGDGITDISEDYLSKFAGEINQQLCKSNVLTCTICRFLKTRTERCNQQPVINMQNKPNGNTIYIY